MATTEMNCLASGGGVTRIYSARLSSIQSDGFVQCVDENGTPFDPRYVIVCTPNYSNSATYTIIYDESISTSQFRVYYQGSAYTDTIQVNPSWAGFESIGNGTNGFKLSSVANWNRASEITVLACA